MQNPQPPDFQPLTLSEKQYIMEAHEHLNAYDKQDAESSTAVKR